MGASACAICGGSGWKIIERDGISSAERCDCTLAGRAGRLEEKAAIPPLYRHASFDNFLAVRELEWQESALKQVLLTVRKYTHEFPAVNPPGLLLIGDAGTGKTHLAVAALRALLARGFEGLFFDYQNLLDRIREGFDPNSGVSDREAYRSAMEAEILLLDDLGSRRVTEWVEDTVTAIVTYRCNQQRPLVATTNLPDWGAGDAMIERSPELPAQSRYKVSLAERIGERARSRLFEMCTVVHMPAVEDYRLRRKALRRF